MSEAELRTAVASHRWLQSLRLRAQHRREASGEQANVLDTRILSDLDRRILKESFRQARTLQQRLAVDFPG